jgi:hypothetical protein
MASVLEGGGWSAPCPSRFTLGKDLAPIVQEAGWAPGPVWTCAKNLAPTGIRSPDHPALSQSLYQLSYLAHIIMKVPDLNLRKLAQSFLYISVCQCKVIKIKMAHAKLLEFRSVQPKAHLTSFKSLLSNVLLIPN